MERTGQAKQEFRVFLCHSSADKQTVRELYRKLTDHGIRAWLDEEDLLAGQDWDLEIKKAISLSHAVLVCLSGRFGTKVGYVNREVKYVLDVADQQPEGAIFLIPVKIERCDIPARFAQYHCAMLYAPNGYEKLLRSLNARAGTLGLSIRPQTGPPSSGVTDEADASSRLAREITEAAAAVGPLHTADGISFHTSRLRQRTKEFPLSKPLYITLGRIYAESRDLNGATDVLTEYIDHKRAAGQHGDIDTATALYNLSCYQILSSENAGDAESRDRLRRAGIADLRTALRIAPEFRTMVMQDPDLSVIRDEILGEPAPGFAPTTSTDPGGE